MADSKDTMYERGFNIAYYLEFYAPNILERAMHGLRGEPKEFFEGLRHGQIQGQKEIEAQRENSRTEIQGKEDMQSRTEEREREAAYKEKLEREKERKTEELMKEVWDELGIAMEEHMKLETEKAPNEEEKSPEELKVEGRIKEVEEIRGEQSKDTERERG